MNSALRIVKKHELWALIRRLGELWEEDPEFTAEYAKSVYESYGQQIDDAINCFKDLVTQAEWIGPGRHKHGKVEEDSSTRSQKPNGSSQGAQRDKPRREYKK